jgi:hypothetical protein
MNILGVVSLVAVLALAVWFVGNEIETVQENSSPERGVFGDTLDAAKGAAAQLGS